MRRPVYYNIVMVLIVLCLGAAVSHAQSIITGAVSGTITDPSGAILPSATVTLVNTGTGDTQNGKTNASGVYLFPLLKPGEYTVTVQESRFRVAVAKVIVTLGQTATGELKLELSDSSQTVEVTLGNVELQTEDGNISSNFDTHQVENVANPAG